MVHSVLKNCLKALGLFLRFLSILSLLICFIPRPSAAAPIEIRDTIPQEDAGIINFARVPDQTAVAVLIRAMHGIDLNEPAAVRFIIDDGHHLPYWRDLGHDAVRAVKLNQTPDNRATYAWVTYDRFLEPFMPTAYPLNAVIRVTVVIYDTRGRILQPQPFEFKIESGEHKIAAGRNIPNTVEFYESQPSSGDGLDSGVAVTDGKLAGARVLYSSLEPLTPEFGSPDEVSSTDRGDMQAVGMPVNLLPHTVFDQPVKIFIPVKEDVDIREVGLAYYDGTDWLPAADEKGTVLPGGEGWMVPGSRVNHDETSPQLIEVQVYHFSAAQTVIFARWGDTPEDDRPPSGTGTNANVSINCFINSISEDPDIKYVNLIVLIGLAGVLLLVQRIKGTRVGWIMGMI